jgi:hypothetical protein
MIDHTLGRVLDLFGLALPHLRRWGETPENGDRHTLRPLKRNKPA